MKIKISATTIKHARYKLGWLSTGTKYCQMVREANRIKRFEDCQELLATKEEFNDVIFTNESSIALESHAKITFHCWWEPPWLKGQPKHPIKEHVWAAISRRGVSEMAIFTGIMEASFFTESILRLHLLPFIRNVYPEGHRFMQDNDPRHTSKKAKE